MLQACCLITCMQLCIVLLYMPYSSKGLVDCTALALAQAQVKPDLATDLSQQAVSTLPSLYFLSATKDPLSA